MTQVTTCILCSVIVNPSIFCANMFGSSPASGDSEALLVCAKVEKTTVFPPATGRYRASDGGHPRGLLRVGGRVDETGGGPSEAHARETRPGSEDNGGWVEPERGREGTDWGVAVEAIAVANARTGARTLWPMGTGNRCHQPWEHPIWPCEPSSRRRR